MILLYLWKSCWTRNRLLSRLPCWPATIDSYSSSQFVWQSEREYATRRAELWQSRDDEYCRGKRPVKVFAAANGSVNVLERYLPLHKILLFAAAIVAVFTGTIRFAAAIVSVNIFCRGKWLSTRSGAVFTPPQNFTFCRGNRRGIYRDNPFCRGNCPGKNIAAAIVSVNIFCRGTGTGTILNQITRHSQKLVI